MGGGRSGHPAHGDLAGAPLSVSRTMDIPVDQLAVSQRARQGGSSVTAGPGAPEAIRVRVRVAAGGGALSRKED